jgi:hypothetical protein
MPPRWLVVAVLAVPAVTGCDSGREGASGATSAPPAATSTSVLESHPILLKSEAGTQDAALMPCVRFTTSKNDWHPVCREAVPALRPSSLSVVRPGETITISFPGAQVENPSGCRETCGAALVQPLGCKDRPSTASNSSTVTRRNGESICRRAVTSSRSMQRCGQTKAARFHDGRLGARRRRGAVAPDPAGQPSSLPLSD